MSYEASLITHYAAVRARLRNPARPAPDAGIDLRRSRAVPAIPARSTVQKNDVRKVLSTTVQKRDVRKPRIDRVGDIEASVCAWLQVRPPRFLIAPLFEAMTGRNEDEDHSYGMAERVELKRSCKSKTRKIMRAVELSFGVSAAALVGDNREQWIVTPRHVAIYLAREMTHASLYQIGLMFGGRDHSTVLNSVKRITARRTRDHEFDERISAIIAEIDSGEKT